jgi:hypothetical protein
VLPPVLRRSLNSWRARWAKDGRTLFYETDRPSWRSQCVAQPLPTGVHRKRCWKVDGPEMFDVAPDGRFLMLKVEGGDAAATTPDSLIVVQNWTEQLKRRVPVK